MLSTQYVWGLRAKAQHSKLTRKEAHHLEVHRRRVERRRLRQRRSLVVTVEVPVVSVAPVVVPDVAAAALTVRRNPVRASRPSDGAFVNGGVGHFDSLEVEVHSPMTVPAELFYPEHLKTIVNASLFFHAAAAA
mmetsp:Transcript_5533/g.15597  ORF Transcript_5533/g.15597 Transcript_5533/m.15597 type:complete len:134 (+) Transcript_5533:23-424(+)